MSTVLLIGAAIIYALITLIWALVWIDEWDSCRGYPSERREAARKALAAPIWPLATLRALTHLFADLRNDAKENL